MFVLQSDKNSGCYGKVEIGNFWCLTQFSKKYSKIFSSEAIRGMKLKLCKNVHDISLYVKYIYSFLLSLPLYFRCYGNLKFPYTYNGKSANWHLFLCYCRYFEITFTEMFLE